MESMTRFHKACENNDFVVVLTSYISYSFAEVELEDVRFFTLLRKCSGVNGNK